MGRSAKKVVIAVAVAAAVLAGAAYANPLATLSLAQSSQLGASGGAPLGDSRQPGGSSLGQSGGETLGHSSPEEPRYIEDGEWTRVADFEDFAKAIEQGKTKIRLTQDIAMKKIIKLEKDLVIDGAHEDGQGRWSINEQTYQRTLRLNAPGLHVTVRNVEITGYDHYGFVSQRDTNSAGSGAVVTYENIHYTGPQLAWLHYEGTLEIRDSVIDIVPLTGAEGQGEVGEAAEFILGGNTRITKKTGTDSLFWIYNYGWNSKKQGLLQIEDNANISIYQGESYLTYRELDVGGVGSYTISIGDNATVDMQMSRGWSRHADRYTDHFEIGRNSRVYMSSLKTESDYLFHVDKSIRVGEGSTWIVEDRLRPAVSLRTAGATVVFDNPELIRIERYIAGKAPGQVVMTGKAFNFWSASGAEQSPDGILNAPYGEAVTITQTGTATYTSRHTGEEKELPGTAFLPYGNTSMKQFAMGRYDLQVNPMRASSAEVNGAMSPDGAMSASYYLRGAQERTTTQAVYAAEHSVGALAGFRVAPGISQGEEGVGPFEQDQDILFRLARQIENPRSQFLERDSRLYALEERRMPDLSPVRIQSFPSSLHFGGHAIPGVDTYFPLEQDAEIVVVDNRPDGQDSNWYLTAKTSPLAGGDSALVDAIGVLENGEFTSFNKGALLWSGVGGGAGVAHSKVWSAHDKANGLAVYITPHQASVADYEATVTWTLSVGL